MKYTKHSLKRIEEIFKESGFKVRYGKGNFKAGHCLLSEQKIIVLNAFFSTESRINSLLDLTHELNFSLLQAESIEYLSKFKKVSA